MSQFVSPAMLAFKAAIEEKKDHRSEESKKLNQVDTILEDPELSPEQKEKAKALFIEAQSNYLRTRRAQTTTADFDLLKTIGAGAFGTVSLVRHKETGAIFALKQMPKKSMKKKNQRDRVMAERNLLAELEGNWVVTLYNTFQDEDNLYMLMEYLSGGDLMSHLVRLDIFTEDQTRFYIAELVEAVNFVHSHGYIHRDIKPDNIVLTKEGHLKLLDFGLCKFEQNLAQGMNLAPQVDLAGAEVKPFHLDRIALKSSVGTPQYMAPDVFTKSYNHLADWWSVGIIMYEALMGGVPFSDPSGNPEKIMNKVMNWRKHLVIPFPGRYMSPDATDLLKHILCEPEKRFGYQEIVQHSYFRGVDFKNLRKYIPLIRPVVRNELDTSNFDRCHEVVVIKSSQKGQRKDKNLEYVGYTYDSKKNQNQLPDKKEIMDIIKGEKK